MSTPESAIPLGELSVALVLQLNGACGGGKYIRGNALLCALLTQPLGLV